MTWVPIVDSGVAYSFGWDGGAGDVDVTLGSDSVVRTTAHGSTGRANWKIDAPTSSLRLRITVLEYDLTSLEGYPAWFRWYGENGEDNLIENEAAPQSEFLPALFEAVVGATSSIYYTAAVRTNGLETYAFLVEAWTDAPDPPDPPEPTTDYNCACDDDYPRTTLKQMRSRIATRLGFATQVAMGALPPGMAELLDDFIRNAQEMLYRRYPVFRLERFYAWKMQPGVRFYDFSGNEDACQKHMDPRMVTWVGVSQGDLCWRPLICGIDPVMYGSSGPGIPSHYEVRQCIEVWPAPVDATWVLRIKGHFGLLPLDSEGDETTIDPEAIFLQALANAKAHYGQPDAGNYAAQATAYVRSLIAGSHHTRRYIPGSAMPPPAVRPVLKED